MASYGVDIKLIFCKGKNKMFLNSFHFYFEILLKINSCSRISSRWFILCFENRSLYSSFCQYFLQLMVWPPTLYQMLQVSFLKQVFSLIKPLRVRRQLHRTFFSSKYTITSRQCQISFQNFPFYLKLELHQKIFKKNDVGKISCTLQNVFFYLFQHRKWKFFSLKTSLMWCENY